MILWRLAARADVPEVVALLSDDVLGAGREAADMAFSTWDGFCEIPKVHYSESKAGARPQAHSDYIREEIPELSDTVQYDVMIEAKAKDLALLEYRKAHLPCLL